MLAGCSGAAKIFGDLGSMNLQCFISIIIGDKNGGEGKRSGGGIGVLAVGQDTPDSALNWAAEGVTAGVQ